MRLSTKKRRVIGTASEVVGYHFFVGPRSLMMCFSLSWLWSLAVGDFCAQGQVPAEPVQADEIRRNPEQNQLTLINELYENAKGTKGVAARRDAFTRCIPLFERFLRDFPNSASRQSVNYRLGYCYLIDRRAMEAEEKFNEVVRGSRDPNLRSAAAYRIGSLLMNRDEFAEAIRYFSITSANAPQNEVVIDARYRIGRCHVRLGNVDKAIEAFRQIVDDQGENNYFVDASRLYLANLLLRKEEFEGALVHYDKLAAPGVDLEVRGEAALQAGRIATVMEDYERANGYFAMIVGNDELAQWKIQAQLGLLGNFYKLSKWRELLDLHRRQPVAMPEDEDVRRLQYLGKAHFELKEYVEAGKKFGQIERLKPLTESAFTAAYRRLLCFYHSNSNSLIRQIDAFLEVYQPRHPNSPLIDQAILLKAEALFNSKQYEEAADTYLALDLRNIGEADRPGVLYRSGWVLTEVGDFQEAERRFTELLTSSPDFSERAQAFTKRAFCRVKLGDHAGGLADYQRIINDFPKGELTAFALQQSALLHSATGNNTEMISLFKRLLKEFPTLKPATVAEAHFMIGKGLFDEEEFQSSLKSFEEARALVPEKYGEAAGMKIVQCNYYLENVSGLKKSVERLWLDSSEARIAPAILTWLGLQCLKIGDYKSTDRYLTKVATPEEPKATKKLVWKNLSAARTRLGRYEAALEANTFFLEEEQEPFFMAEGNLERAEILLGLGRIDEALVSVEGALELNPQGALLANLRMMLGDIDFARGEFDKAAAHYVVVSELFANDDEIKPLAKSKSADALERAGKMTEADKIRAEIARDFPSWKRK